MAKMSQQQILDMVEKDFIKSDVPVVDIGDTVNIHFRIAEGGKEHTQVFQGVLISRTGHGINEMMTVRRIVDEVGIERCFPINSPLVGKIEAVRRADARRAKLYYLRDRAGKSRRLRDRRRGMKLVAGLAVAGQEAAKSSGAEKDAAKTDAKS
jgi:large subunit ribosomal protein L19